MRDRNNPLAQWLDSIANSGRPYTRQEVAAELPFRLGVSPTERHDCISDIVDATVRMAAAAADGEKAHARRISALTAEQWQHLFDHPADLSEEIPDNDARGLANAIRRTGVA